MYWDIISNGRPRNGGKYEVDGSEVKKNSPWILKSLNDILKFINYQKFGDRISISYNKHMKKVKITLKKNALIKFFWGLNKILDFHLVK